MPQLLLCSWANLDHSVWPYRALIHVRLATGRKRDALPSLRWSCLKAAQTSALGGESTLSPTPDWSWTRWEAWSFSGHDGGTAKVVPVFKIFKCATRTTGGWFELWILRRVFAQEDKTQGSSASHDLQCCCPRNGSCEREFTRFVCLHVHISG